MAAVLVANVAAVSTLTRGASDSLGLTTASDMRWKLIDRDTGAENAAIDWRLRIGDQLKIRLLNEMAGDHPMHHPFHVHGAGRFLVLTREGVDPMRIAYVLY